MSERLPVRTPQLPGPLRWDHNAHYHRWLVRQRPRDVQRTLDVGCGHGTLACRLAGAGIRVDAVDVSPRMIELAATRCSHREVRWLLGDVLDAGLPLARERYDAVTAVASLHHLPLRPALARLAGLVRPGGVLAVVGLYRPVTHSDRALGVLALPANAVVGLALALTGRAGRPYDLDMPVRAPRESLAEVAEAAGEVLPGARLRRALFWRYLLVWRRAA